MGPSVGISVGESEGVSEGVSVGASVGAGVGQIPQVPGQKSCTSSNSQLFERISQKSSSVANPHEIEGAPEEGTAVSGSGEFGDVVGPMFVGASEGWRVGEAILEV